jgi:two-component system phosphate regulon response regulator PhoB
MAKARLLLIEDDPDIQELLRYTLDKEGFFIEVAASAEEGLGKLRRENFDLLVLDIMLPGISGIDALRRIKADSQLDSLKIIIASARGEDPDVVLGLELGADDYVVKPWSPRVLGARIRRLLRSQIEAKVPETVQGEASAGPFRIVPERHEAWCENRRVDLSATEYALLEIFVRNPGIVFSRSRVISAVRGEDYPVTDRAVDVQVLGLRKKLGLAGDWIETVRGVGYRLKDEL